MARLSKERMLDIIESARYLLSEMKGRGGDSPEPDTAIERSPELARGFLDLVQDYAEAKGQKNPMDGLGYDNLYAEDWEEDEEL